MSKEIRARIKYSKSFPASYIGHLDTINCMKRALRRSGWPVVLTRGFNPRIKLSTSPPLSLGFSSDTEFIDVSLQRHPGKYRRDILCSEMISGFKILEIRFLSEEDKEINSLIEGFFFSIKGENLPEKKIDDAEFEIKKDEMRMKVYKKGGNIRNPVKLLGGGDFKVKKLYAFDAEEEAI